MTETRTYRGGRVNAEADAPPPRLRYPCFANGCPMPGTIFLGAGVGGTGDRPGSCAWHYGVLDTDIPKVTKVLQDWGCVSFEVNEARRLHTGEAAANPRVLAEAFASAWQRLEPLVAMGGWLEELRPGQANTSRGEQLAHREDYAAWGRRLERFIGARVVEVLSTRHRRAA